VVSLQLIAGQAVAGHERAAGPQYPGDLREQSVLKLVRLDVVQHREARSAGEAVVGIWKRRGVAADDLYRRHVREAVRQHGRELVVDLDRGEPRRRLAQHVGRCAVPGADLEHVVTEVGLAQCPGQDDFSDRLSPFVAAASLVRFVHECSV
jgi:hypothetical protein